MNRRDENPHQVGTGRALLIVPSQSSSCSVFAGLAEVSRGGDGDEGAPESCEDVFATDLGSLAHPLAGVPGRLAVRSLVDAKRRQMSIKVLIPLLYSSAGARDCLTR